MGNLLRLAGYIETDIHKEERKKKDITISSIFQYYIEKKARRKGISRVNASHGMRHAQPALVITKPHPREIKKKKNQINKVALER
jgi:hypothetical protein